MFRVGLIKTYKIPPFYSMVKFYYHRLPVVLMKFYYIVVELGPDFSSIHLCIIIHSLTVAKHIAFFHPPRNLKKILIIMLIILLEIQKSYRLVAYA